MRLLRFKTPDGHPALGARVDDEVINLTELGLPGTLDELLRHGAAGMASVTAAIAKATKRIPLKNVQLMAPLHNPHKAFAIGLNYLDHAHEGNFDPPKQPVLFHRYPTSWVPHGVAIERPKASIEFDYEGEIVAIIGKGGKYITKEKALDHVAGYSLFNMARFVISNFVLVSGCGVRILTAVVVLVQSLFQPMNYLEGLLA